MKVDEVIAREARSPPAERLLRKRMAGREIRAELESGGWGAPGTAIMIESPKMQVRQRNLFLNESQSPRTPTPAPSPSPQWGEGRRGRAATAFRLWRLATKLCKAWR
jgi:hypothetical protein